MTRRIIAAVFVLLLPLADAAQWASCGPLGDSMTASMMEMEAGMGMPMDDESALCAQEAGADQNGHDGGPCDSSPGSRHGCQASVPCGVAFVTVTPSSAQPVAAAAVDLAVWRHQVGLGTGPLRPEPPPPRS
ncbi:MAG: hypothetical protein O2973_03605 [Gemmatimonadetes bacterium]|nr:hypothetical protein [Gemmatimonadota bacterium]